MPTSTQHSEGVVTAVGERALFERCLVLGESEREALLAAAGHEDPELAERVRRLLASHAQLEAEPGLLPEIPRAEPDPIQIGPYRIRRRLGKGGMGVVYLAEQEQPIRRTVALKVIRWGFDTAEVIARFETERQALALMSHPNIARILDAGTTSAGRPYFVMECVRGGDPIIAFCDRRQLTVRQRIALLLDVCRAAHHAHVNGVVHRDLKPSNILVTDADGMPTPKVIDFGVSKALYAPLTPQSLETRSDAFIGTPGYMSPEQMGMSGEIDARSDVFSLGAVLYELISGVRPGASDSGQSAPRLDTLLDVPRASERIRQMPLLRAENVARARGTTSLQLRRQLKRDVDWVAARALALDPDSRYPSALAMAADLERLLDERPVSAVPGLPYRLGKGFRPYRAYVWTAALTAGLLAALFLGAPAAPEPLDASAVAVLPLEQIGDGAQTLADGLHESLITELSHAPELSVIARGSVLAYAGTRRSSTDIGRELGAGSVLEGTVQRVEDRLRVTVRLVRVEDGFQSWGDQFDRPYRLDELLDVQLEIAAQVAAELSATLHPAHAPLTGSLDALEAFYAGNTHYLKRYERPQADSAVLAFERAVDLDPSFGVAYAALADARIWRFWQFAEGGDAARAVAALARARDLAPTTAQTRVAEAAISYRLYHDYADALRHLLAADSIAPGDARIQETIGWVLRRRGEWEEALARLEGAARLSPRRPGLLYTVGHTLHMLHRFDEAGSWFDRLNVLEPRAGRNGPFEARIELYTSLADTAALRRLTDVLPSGARMLERDIVTTLAFYERRYDDALAAGGTLRVWPFSREMDGAAGQALLYHLAGRTAQRDALADSLRTAYEAQLQFRLAEEVNARARAYGGLALAHALLGNRNEARAAAQASHRTLSLAVDAYSGRFGEQRLAAVHLLLGDREEALDLLEQLLSVPNELTPALLDLDPRTDVLRGDPRFEALLERDRGTRRVRPSAVRG